MSIKRKNTEAGEGGLTLKGLFKELNELFKEGNVHFLDEDDKESTAEVVELEDGSKALDISQEDLVRGYVSYDRVRDAVMDGKLIYVNDAHGKKIPTIAFLAAPQMIEGVVDTIREMNAPTIVAFEDELITKAFIAKGIVREEMLMKHNNIPALMFDEDGGICRLSINNKDGYSFVFGENGVTRFIIFDETVCPDIIPIDIVSDDKKWGKRMIKEIPNLIEKYIEDSKSEEKKLPFADAVKPYLTKIDIPNLTEKKSAMCNLPETCAFDDCPHDVKKPIIADIMKDFTDAKNNGKVGKDDFIEFMKPENKEAVAKAVTESISERMKPVVETIEKDEVTKAVESAIYENGEDDFTDEDTNPDCFRCIAEYMAKESVDSIHFYTDDEGLIHCDVKIKTVYKVELDK